MRRHSCEGRPGLLGGLIQQHVVTDTYDRGDDSTTVQRVTLECDGCGESWEYTETAWHSMTREEREKTASIDPDSPDPKAVERTSDEKMETAKQIDGLRTEKAMKGMRRRLGMPEKTDV